MDLLSDSDLQVRLEAMIASVEVMAKNYFPEEIFEIEVLPIFLNHMKLLDQDCEIVLSKLIG
jgi:hypothetical protein